MRVCTVGEELDADSFCFNSLFEMPEQTSFALLPTAQGVSILYLRCRHGGVTHSYMTPEFQFSI